MNENVMLHEKLKNVQKQKDDLEKLFSEQKENETFKITRQRSSGPNIVDTEKIVEDLWQASHFSTGKMKR